MNMLSKCACLLFVLGSQIENVQCACAKSSDCSCVDQVCQDADEVVYGGLACFMDEQCYCDTSTKECQYSRAPVTDPPTLFPTISNKPSTSAPTLSNKPSLRASASPSVTSSGRPSVVSSTSPSASSTDSPSTAPSDGSTTIVPTTLAPSTEFPTEYPSSRPSGGCENSLESCGWGVWNPWTCQCDCAPGFCLSANQHCYDGCTTNLDFNPFAGCTPGYDCPWYPSKLGEAHCQSTVVIAGIYNIYRTVKECCEKHFSALNIDTCISESKASVTEAGETITKTSTRTSQFYPDLYGRDNCVFNNQYFDWMMESNTEWYLFGENETSCCETWYPSRVDCPDLSETTANGVDENPYPVTGYFYPHMADSNCRFGRNYPQWMVQELYIKHYLYTTPDECCAQWYPHSYNCPLGPDDGVQEGQYWINDVAFYPNWAGNYCAVGNTYPKWMSDPMNRDWHLFDSAKGCCEKWFPDDVVACEMNVDVNYNVTDGSKSTKEWYPTQYPYDCVEVNEQTPEWMSQEGYRQFYIFNSYAECCRAHYCS